MNLIKRFRRSLCQHFHSNKATDSPCDSKVSQIEHVAQAISRRTGRIRPDRLKIPSKTQEAESTIWSFRSFSYIQVMRASMKKWQSQLNWSKLRRRGIRDRSFVPGDTGGSREGLVFTRRATNERARNYRRRAWDGRRRPNPR